MKKQIKKEDEQSTCMSCEHTCALLHSRDANCGTHIVHTGIWRQILVAPFPASLIAPSL